jgi:hypothetical protein
MRNNGQDVVARLGMVTVKGSRPGKMTGQVTQANQTKGIIHPGDPNIVSKR